MNKKIGPRAKTLGRDRGRGKTSLFNLQGHLLYSLKEGGQPSQVDKTYFIENCTLQDNK